MKKILCISLMSILFISCKKNKSTTDPSPPAIQSSPYSVSTATVFSGFFFTGKYTYSYGINYTRSSVCFVDPASAIPDSNNIITVADVILNNEVIDLYTFNNSYLKESFPAGSFGNETWQIHGSNTMTSFNYTDSYIPDCINYNTLPDSISISAGVTFTLNITDITPTNSLINMGDNYGHWTPAKPLHNGINIISFTPMEMYNFVANTTCDIGIYLQHTQVLNFYGKDFQFLKVRSYDKVIKLKS